MAPFKRTAAKLLGGALFLVVLFGISIGYRAIAASAGEAERERLLEDACSHLRELTSKELASCEADLQKEQKALGGFYPRKLRCLAALPSVENYKQCSNLEHLKSFPE